MSDLYFDGMLNVSSHKGIDFCSLSLKKFKTSAITVCFYDVIQRDTVTKNSLLPSVLKRGCEGYESFDLIAKKLEEIYGAVISCGSEKKGQYNNIYFCIEFINDEFDKDSIGVVKECANLLFKIITSPVVENGGFRKTDVEIEKEHLKVAIESRINDKMTYAVERCIELMCEGENNGIREVGYVEDLKDIDEKNLYEHYKNVMSDYNVCIFVSGNIEDKDVEEVKEVFDKLERKKSRDDKKVLIMKDVSNVRNFEERIDVNQAKLTIGYRTYTTFLENEYYDLMVFNTIFGGSFYSKLFKEVREKNSLAYYIHSTIDKFSGIMLVYCGIDSNHKDKTCEIIGKCLQDMKEGNFDDDELKIAIVNIENTYRMLLDKQMRLVDFYFGQYIYGVDRPIPKILESIKNVKKDGIKNAASRIKLDTVYFLRP